MLRATLATALLALAFVLPAAAEGAGSFSVRYVGGGEWLAGGSPCSFPTNSCGCANLFFNGFDPRVGGDRLVVRGLCDTERPRADLLSIEVADATGLAVPFHWEAAAPRGVEADCPEGTATGSLVDAEVPEICSRVTVFLGQGATTGILTVS